MKDSLSAAASFSPQLERHAPRSSVEGAYNSYKRKSWLRQAPPANTCVDNRLSSEYLFEPLPLTRSDRNLVKTNRVYRASAGLAQVYAMAYDMFTGTAMQTCGRIFPHILQEKRFF